MASHCASPASKVQVRVAYLKDRVEIIAPAPGSNRNALSRVRVVFDIIFLGLIDSLRLCDLTFSKPTRTFLDGIYCTTASNQLDILEISSGIA